MKNTLESRRLFTIVTFAVISISSILIFAFVPKQSEVAEVGLLAVILSSLVLMFYTLIGKPIDLRIEGKTQTKAFNVTFGTVRGKSKTVRTFFGSDAKLTDSEEIVGEEKILRNKLFDIFFEDGLTYDNCQKGLNLLNNNPAVVKKSWRLTLNKARLLAPLQRYHESEKIALSVIKRFSKNREAVGTGYDVLSWNEEFQEPKTKGIQYESWLEKRKCYVSKGLEVFPQSPSLLMNAFQIAILESNAVKALYYLTRAVTVNSKLVKAILVQLEIENIPLITLAKELSLELKKEIEGINGGRKMVKSNTLILMLVTILVFSLSVNIGYPQSRAQHNFSTVSTNSVNTVENTTNVDCFFEHEIVGFTYTSTKTKKEGTILNKRNTIFDINKGGTLLSLSKDGTLLSFSKKGTIFGLKKIKNDLFYS
ncbi:MAG: hypothetical protein WA584_17105 [Pyrinomonadaceae bacterium]